ncbi:MAG: Holliday junction resolvase RuvX [Holophagales bacterium]|nr:Holliday junction resolvase RuvX [Holophagales bacterium]
MRWMAIDHGTKKIGIAFCDEMEIISTPFATWPMEGHATLENLCRLAATENARAILVGLPLHQDGNESATAELAKKFGLDLAKMSNLPIEFLNEHLSSSEAKRLLAQGSARPKAKKGQSTKLDAAAAAVLLQEHLENRRNQKPKAES